MNDFEYLDRATELTTQEIEEIRREIVVECDATMPADDTPKLRRFAYAKNIRNLRRIEHLLTLARRRDGEAELAAMSPEERAELDRREIDAAEAIEARLDSERFALASRLANPVSGMSEEDAEESWMAAEIRRGNSSE